MLFTKIGGWGLHHSCIVALKEVKEGARKQGNIEHTVVANDIALWNIGVQWTWIVLLNMFAYKESSTHMAIQIYAFH
jgi:hypothetical protein